MQIGNNISTQMHGTAFTAVSTSATNRTEKEMAAEEIQRNGQNPEAANISYETKFELSDSSLVVFNDPTNDKLAVVSLKNSTLSMLKDHFGEDDFYKRDDGLVRLDNKAEAYVSGWFGDIAYKRGFLEADSNNDGRLSDSEYKNTKNEFAGHGFVGIGRIDEYVDQSYVQVGGNDSSIVRYNRTEYQKPTTIDEELRDTLKINTDFNDSISLRETFNKNDQNITKSTHDLIEEHTQEAGYEEEELEQLLKLIRKELLEELNNKKANAIEKVLSGDMDLTVLDDTEKLLLKDVLSIENKDDMEKALNKEFNELKKIKKFER